MMTPTMVKELETFQIRLEVEGVISDHDFKRWTLIVLVNQDLRHGWLNAQVSHVRAAVESLRNTMNARMAEERVEIEHVTAKIEALGSKIDAQVAAVNQYAPLMTAQTVAIMAVVEKLHELLVELQEPTPV